MSGFVYLWFDRKHKRYYIGSHWGTEDDGYICSSRWMRKAYRRRPEDFKRRIIARIHTNRKDLLIEEKRWLRMIKPEERKIRYYNLNIFVSDYWWADEDTKKTVGEKISVSLQKPDVKLKRSLGQQGRVFTEEHRAKMAAVKRGQPGNATGSKRTEETRKKMSESRMGTPAWNKGVPWSDETRSKISMSLRNRPKATHCRKGHELTEANLVSNGPNKRICGICKKERRLSR